jgi:thiol:disulfide interchange protein
MIVFRAYLLSFVFLLSLFSFNSSEAAELDPLPVEEAFLLKTDIEPKTGEITLEWKIAPNTYLYQKKNPCLSCKP